MVKKLTSLQKNRLLTTAIIAVTIIAIVSISSSIFFSISNQGFSELSLLTYNSSSQTFEADQYPYTLESGTNDSVFFMVKNFENIVKYYQIRIKATKLSQNVTYEQPLTSSNSYQMYNNKSYEKILSFANNKEKREVGVFIGDYIWGPVNVTLYSNTQIEIMLGGEEYMKIVFELWEFNSEGGDFIYSGIFTFLELMYVY
jgi:hypothetical protein